MAQITEWNALENEIEACLKHLQRFYPLAYLRFYDTKSAGNALPAQPADFLAAHNGRSLFIEAKFSEVHSSLYSCFSNNVDSQQLASARIWGRAGVGYIILFYSDMTDTVEVWDGLPCAKARENGKRLDRSLKREYPSVETAIMAEVMK